MESEQIHAVSRLASVQARPPVKPAEGSPSGSTPVTPTPSAPVGDTVTLSVQGQRAAQQEGAAQDAQSENLHRELEVTDSNQVVLKIKDGSTQQVVKQIPPEEQIQLREAIQNIVEAQAEG